MTSKILSVKIAQSKFSQNIWSIVISFLGFFFTMTVPLYMHIIKKDEYSNEINYATYAHYYITDSILVSFIILVLGFVIPIMLFRYLNSKSEVDFYHSLPIKREKIFLSNYLLGIFVFIIAFFANIIISTLLLTANISNELLDIYSILTKSIELLSTFLGLYSLITFTTILTGNIFMSVSCGIGIAFVPYTYSTIVAYLCNIFIPNVYLGNIYANDFLKSINPINVLMDFYSIFDHVLTIICMLSYCIIFCIFAYFIFKIRPSENSSNAVALNFAKPIIKFIGVLGASFIGGVYFYTASHLKTTFLFTGFIFVGFIVHCLFEMLYEADFKAIFTNIKQFLVYVVISLIGLFCLTQNVFSIGMTLPSLNSIKSASINFYGTYSNSSVPIVTLTEKENIQYLYNIANYSLIPSDEYNKNLYIEFHLEDGQTKKRLLTSYDYKSNLSSDYYNLVLSDEYISSVYNYELNADDIYSLYFNRNSIELEADLAKEIYSIFMQENVEISGEYYKSNLPVIDFTIFLKEPNTDNVYDTKLIYVYETHAKTIDFITKNVNDINFIDLTNNPEITLVKGFKNINIRDSVSDFEIYEQIKLDIIPFLSDYYVTRYIPELLADNDSVIYVFQENIGKHIGYISSDNVYKYADYFK